MQTFYSLQLPADQFEIRIANDGQEAIDVYASAWSPDLIMLDINMPNLSGYNTLKIIREGMNDTAVPVIIVSSQSDREKVIACAKLGIHGYIIKPFKKEELLDKISKCLCPSPPG